MAELIEIRCQNIVDGIKCNALLCRAAGEVEISCRRCGCRNIHNARTGITTAYPVKRRSAVRTTSSGVVFR